MININGVFISPEAYEDLRTWDDELKQEWAMKEYDIVYNTSRSGLVEEVNALLADGWKLAGGVVVDTAAFYQAVCRKIKNRPVRTRVDEYGEEY